MPRESYEATYTAVVPEGEEVRCPHWVEKKNGICNKLLFRGLPSKTPQEFYCDRCKLTIVVQRID